MSHPPDREIATLVERATRTMVGGEAELVRRIQANDLDAFEEFFERHRGLIYRTAYALTGDPCAAEEILQDAFVRAYRHRATLDPEVSPLPWLHRVTLNLCYSYLGRRRVRTEPIGEFAADTMGDGCDGPAELSEREELRRSVRAGIASLSEKHQGVVVLYYLHGMSLQETADTLGIRLGTVKSRLHYALDALRLRLGGERAPHLAPARLVAEALLGEAPGPDAPARGGR